MSNRFKLVIFVFIFIIIFCVIGSLFVQANTEIKSEEDILDVQNKINNSINVYGYSFNNPNVIVDPYTMNYNSALIVFETDEYVSIKVNVNDIYSYNSKKTNKHYIGVYNLLVGENNITLSYGKNKKNIKINFSEGDNIIDLENSFVLSNNHLLVSTGDYFTNDSYTGVREVDALGKIYYEYLLKDGYKGFSCEIDEERLAVLSKNLIILDRQNGNVIKSYEISKYSNDWISMDYVDSKINLYSDEITISIDEDGNISEIEEFYEKAYFSGDINYDNKEGIRFYDEIITETSNENIWLLSYGKRMKNDIKIKKEFNRIIVSGDDINNCNNYLILDQLSDKRVYELCNKDNYIYTYDMDGKYSVYFKVDNKVYKTDKYLKF